MVNANSPELRLTLKLLRVRERAVNRNRAVQRRFALECLHVRHAQQRAEIEAGEFELGVRRIVAMESSLPVQGESGLLQLRGGVVFEARPAECAATWRVPKRCPPKVSAVTRGMALRANRCADRSTCRSR